MSAVLKSSVSLLLFARLRRAAILWAMSNRELVIGLVSRLPEDTPLEDIAREIELLAGIRAAREQTARREGIPAEGARKLVETWAGQ